MEVSVLLMDKEGGSVIEVAKERGVTEGKHKSPFTSKDSHEPWEAHGLGLIQGNGSAGVTFIRLGGACRILDLW
jgi:hypothetical protein